MLSQTIINGALILSLGEQLALPANTKSIWIEKKEVLQVIEKKSNSFLKAMGEGFSNLKIDNKEVEVTVLSKKQKNLISNKKIPLGLFFKLDQAQVQLDGAVVREKDLITILDLTQKNQLPFIFKAQMDDAIKKKYLSYIEQRLQHEGLNRVDIQFNGVYFCNLRSNSNRNLIQTLRQLGIVIKFSQSQLAVEPTVKVEITIAEVKKEFSQKMGLKPPSGYSATVLEDLTTQLDSFKFEVQALENKGMGKILASPNILCRSGKDAEFFAGGEFPIKIISFNRQDILWKKYGILLKVKPLADFSGQISLSIETEISSLDMSQMVDGIPGLKTNKVNSHFDLNKSKTIALSGLLKEEEGQSSEGLPFLQRIPILGYLFSSKDYRESRTELIIFVRPSIVENSFQENANSHLGSIDGN